MRNLDLFNDHPSPFPSPVYRAICFHVTDGDTYDFLVDLGFFNYHYITVRLASQDTPEIFRPKSEEEKILGMRAKSFAEKHLLGKPVLLETKKGMTFGRFVADVKIPKNGVWWDFGDLLVAESLTKDFL